MNKISGPRFNFQLETWKVGTFLLICQVNSAPFPPNTVPIVSECTHLQLVDFTVGAVAYQIGGCGSIFPPRKGVATRPMRLLRISACQRCATPRSVESRGRRNNAVARAASRVRFNCLGSVRVGCRRYCRMDYCSAGVGCSLACRMADGRFQVVQSGSRTCPNQHLVCHRRAAQSRPGRVSARTGSVVVVRVA